MRSLETGEVIMMIRLTGVALAFILAGCSSTKTATEITQDQLRSNELKSDAQQEKAEKALASLPSWVLTPPKPDENGVYGVGIGQSKKLDVSMKKSNLNAQYELAKSFGQAMAGNERSYTKDGNTGEVSDYTQLIDSIVATVPINGYEAIKSDVVVSDGKYTTYTLIYLPYAQFERSIGAAKQASTDDKIKGEFNDFYERLDSLKADTRGQD